MAVYLALGPTMEHRHDPCVLYIQMTAEHLLKTGGALPWWKFTESGKKLLAQHS